MLPRKDQDNTADYFPVQCCSWAIGQHYTGNFLVQCWHRQIKTTLYRLFSCENVFVRSGPTLHKQFSCAMLSQTYLDNIDQTIFLCNVVPACSIQDCISYFSHKSCLFAMGQHCTGDFLVQSWRRKIWTPLQIMFLCKVVFRLCTMIGG